MQRDQRTDLLQDLGKELHNLCQPLTALQCLLELALMPVDPELMRFTIRDSLIETERMFVAVARLRERLVKEEARRRAESEAYAGRNSYGH